MLSVSPAIRIFVHALPTDMRMHFDGLCAIVTYSFGKDAKALASLDYLRGRYA